MKRVFHLFVFLFLIYNVAVSQYFSTGQEPFNTKWQQITSDNFQIIFPDDYVNEAIRIANILESSITYVSKTLNYKPNPISVVIHSNTASANGLVAWAPKRMELYPTVDHTPEPGDWLIHLAIHESRHVVQIDKLNQGVTKILYYLFGEQVTGLVLGLYLPLWFLEGDAVCTETALTESGRGQIPSFSETLFPIIVENNNYSFDKASFGSYKDYIPNHYQFGYNFTAYLRTKYGKNIWDNVLNYVAKKPYSITPFNNALKIKTGKNKTELFIDFKDSISSYFADKQKLESYNALLNNSTEYQNYYSPVFINGEIYAIKTSLNDITRIVSIKENKEEIIYTPGFMNDYRLKAGNGKLVWTEQLPDIRWHNRDYSVIKILDLKTEKVTQVGDKSRFYNPSIHGDSLVFNELKNTTSDIIIFSLTKNAVLDTIRFKETHFVNPQIINEKQILTIIHKNDGQSIALIDIETKNINYLTDKTFHEIKNPILTDSLLVYVSGKKGINNIYALTIKNGLEKILTQSKYVINDIVLNNENLFFTNYSLTGYKIEYQNINHLLEREINISENGFLFTDTLRKQEYGAITNSIISANNFNVKKYSRLKHLFNFHSWGLLYYNLEDFEFNPGVTFLGQNVLNTSFIDASYEKNMATNADYYRINWSYRGFYPRIDNSFTYGLFNTYYVTHTHNLIKYDIEQYSYDIDVLVPINLTNGKFSKYLQPQIGHSYVHRNVNHIWQDSVFTGKISSLNYALIGSILLKKAHQNIYPKFGIEIQYQYKHSPFSENNLGEILSFKNTFYLPGLFTNNSIVFNAEYQTKSFESYQYADIVSTARGYHNPANTEMFNARFNYTLPVFYPDFSLSSLAYIKRIYLTAFHDYSKTHHANFKNLELQSTGLDIISDMHLFRIIVPVKMGLRTIYLHNIDDVRFEFLFRLDLSSL